MGLLLDAVPKKMQKNQYMSCHRWISGLARIFSYHLFWFRFRLMVLFYFRYVENTRDAVYL